MPKRGLGKHNKIKPEKGPRGRHKKVASSPDAFIPPEKSELELLSGKWQDDERVAVAARELSRCCSEQEIHKILVEDFGMDSRSDRVEIISVAKSVIVLMTGKTRHELRSDSLAFYMSVKADRSLDMEVRIKAQERIDKLYGLEASQHLEIDHRVIAMDEKKYLEQSTFEQDFITITAAAVSGPSLPSPRSDGDEESVYSDQAASEASSIPDATMP